MVKKVLMVCLGNICRSPIAEAVFQNIVKERGIADQWQVDSAGIGGWHAEKPPDDRATKVLSNHNINYRGRARQIEDQDFADFDYIFGMDDNNVNNLESQAPANTRAQIMLLGDYDPQGEKIIRDPYYDRGSQGFEKCYQQCVRCCNAFLNTL